MATFRSLGLARHLGSPSSQPAFRPHPINLMSGLPLPLDLAHQVKNHAATDPRFHRDPSWLPAAHVPRARARGVVELGRAATPVRFAYTAVSALYNVEHIVGARRIPDLPDGSHGVWSMGGWYAVPRRSPTAEALDRCLVAHGFSRKLWAAPRTLPSAMVTRAPAILVDVPEEVELFHASDLRLSGALRHRRFQATKRHYWGATGQPITLENKREWNTFADRRNAIHAWFLTEDLAALQLTPKKNEEPVIDATIPRRFICFQLATSDDRGGTTVSGGCASNHTRDDEVLSPSLTASVLKAAPPLPSIAESLHVQDQLRAFSVCPSQPAAATDAEEGNGEGQLVHVLRPGFQWVSIAWAAIRRREGVAAGKYIDAQFAASLGLVSAEDVGQVSLGGKAKLPGHQGGAEPLTPAARRITSSRATDREENCRQPPSLVLIEALTRVQPYNLDQLEWA